MTYNDLPEKQRLILQEIKQSVLSRGYPPSIRELCDAVGLKSPASVLGHLKMLEKNGFIIRDPTKPRAIEIKDPAFNLDPKDFISVPILGRVAAGQPLFATENITSYFTVQSEFLPSGTLFMLKVQGDSMINAGIQDGDYIIVRRTDSAANGDIVIAMLEDEATVKYFYREKKHIRLQPANDNYDPIIVKEVAILGQVVGVFRTF